MSANATPVNIPLLKAAGVSETITFNPLPMNSQTPILKNEDKPWLTGFSQTNQSDSKVKSEKRVSFTISDNKLHQPTQKT